MECPEHLWLTNHVLLSQEFSQLNLKMSSFKTYMAGWHYTPGLIVLITLYIFVVDQSFMVAKKQT
jgi:hypothetical protein